MQLDITDLTYEGTWYDFGDGRLKIRPYPATKSDVVFRDGSLVITGENQFEVFSYCLEAWENIVDAEEKLLVLTDDVKQKVFDFQLAGIPLFVLNKVRSFEQQKADREKNFSTGRAGSSKKVR